MNKKSNLLKIVPSVRHELLTGAVQTKNIKEYCQFIFSLLTSILKVDKACLNFCNLNVKK